jgi:hypothetical protein
MYIDPNTMPTTARVNEALYLFIGTCVTLVLCWFVVVGRMTFRFLNGLKGWDDFLMAAGLISFTFFAMFTIWGINKGMLADDMPNNWAFWTEDIRKEAGWVSKPLKLLFLCRVDHFQLYFACQVSYTIGTIPIRCSIAWALLRIATVQWQRTGLITLIGIIIFSAGTILIALVAYTHSITTQFLNNPEPTETGLRLLVYAFSSLSALEDLAILVMPCLMLYKLQRHSIEKIAIVGILAVGGIACVANFARLAFLSEFGRGDTRARRDVLVCSSTELALGIIAGSLASLKPLFGKYFPTRGPVIRPFALDNLAR